MQDSIVFPKMIHFSETSFDEILRNNQDHEVMKSFPKKVILTLIVKFLGYELGRLPGKLIHQKIMSTYTVF